MNYTIHDEVSFSFGGSDYLAKDFENANGRKLEIYQTTPGDWIDRFVGYAHELGFLGTLALYAFGRLDVELDRRSSDDGICSVKSANLIAYLEPNRGSDGGLDVWIYRNAAPGEDQEEVDSGRTCDIEGVRRWLGRIELGIANERFGVLAA